MLQAGQRLDDYKIIGFLTSGGMGEIYLAEEFLLGRQVAIKIMRPEAMRYPNSDEGRKITQLFQREAAAIARLNHPNILPLYKFGVTAMDAYPLMYMVMPYCQEKSLYDWMYARGKIILSPQEVDHVLRQIVEALQYAHDQGMIHLDIKPSNFLVRYQTDDINRLNLQLTDFGVAKYTASNGMSRTVRGSLEYMAPEQWENQAVFATDQYALSIMIYQLLTGQLPFNGPGFEQLWHQHRFTQPLPPSLINRSISPSIDSVLLRGLAKNPNDRYPSVMAFANAFRQALQYSPTVYASIHQTLSLSLEEASRGTTRSLALPSGEILPVTVPPGAYQGQIITIPRQYGPMITITIQILAVTLPLSLPPISHSSSYSSALSSWNSTPSLSTQLPRSSALLASYRKHRLLIVAGLILVLIIGIGLFWFNHYPILQGTYLGNFQFSTDSQLTQMTLDITRQNQQKFEGTCTTISSLFGTNTFTLERGTVDRSGNIQFTIVGTDFAGNTLVRTFTGTPQSGGGWEGTFSDTDGNRGTWSVS